VLWRGREALHGYSSKDWRGAPNCFRFPGPHQLPGLQRLKSGGPRRGEGTFVGRSSSSPQRASVPAPHANEMFFVAIGPFHGRTLLSGRAPGAAGYLRWGGVRRYRFSRPLPKPFAGTTIKTQASAANWGQRPAAGQRSSLSAGRGKSGDAPRIVSKRQNSYFRHPGGLGGDRASPPRLRFPDRPKLPLPACPWLGLGWKLRKNKKTKLRIGLAGAQPPRAPPLGYAFMAGRRTT